MCDCPIAVLLLTRWLPCRSSTADAVESPRLLNSRAKREQLRQYQIKYTANGESIKRVYRIYASRIAIDFHDLFGDLNSMVEH